MLHSGSYKPLKTSSIAFRNGDDENETFDLYMYPSSPASRAVLMTAKEIQIPVNIKIVDLLKGEHMRPEFLKMNPLHTVPTIDDHGFYLFESRAIMRYIVSKFAPESSLYPKEQQKRAQVDKILEFDHGHFYPAFKLYFVPLYIEGIQPSPKKQERYVTVLTQLENFLSKMPYVAGPHLTLADLSLFAEITFTELIDYDYSEYPKIQQWMSRLKLELPYHKEVNVESMSSQFREFVLSNIGKID